MSRAEDPPPRGTRPKNRREVTIGAATELFYRRGYANVSVAEIARATNVGSSAIFRHFGTKSGLLVESIERELLPFETVLAATDVSAGLGDSPLSLTALLTQLAKQALEHRTLGVLWQREARGLDEVDQKRLRDRLSATTRSLARFLTHERPELTSDNADFLAWCVMGTLVSIGFHSLELPRDRYVSLLVELTQTIVRIEFNDDDALEVRPHVPLSTRASRRDTVVSEAAELFAERGFGTVAVDDIGEAAGIAGPSIYNHFPSKQKVLLAAIEQGNTLLRSEADDIFASEQSPESKLGRLVASYVRLAIGDRFLIRIVLSEVNQLAPADRDYARQQQRDYIERWTALAVTARSTDPVSARIRVQAVLLVVSDAVQTPHLRAMAGFERALVRIGRALLGLPDGR